MDTIETPTAGPRSLQVLSRAVSVLRAIQNGPDGGASLSQLARDVGLPRSTVHRLLGGLQAEGLTSTDATGRIVLGPELRRLAGSSSVDVARRMRPVMQDLHDDLQETVDLAVLEGDHLRFVDQIAAAHRLRAVSAVGAVFPLHCTANGKAVLSTLSPKRLEQVLPDELRRFTPNTIVSRSALMQEIAEIRATGLAVDREEHTEGICAMGFAVAQADGECHAITVPVPAQRFAGRESVIARALDHSRSSISSLFDRDA